MSKIFTFLLCFTIALLVSNADVSAQTTKDTWKEFVSEEGGFKVKMPVLPTRVVSKVQLDFGKVDMIQQRVITTTAGYLVSYLEFPSAITDKEEILMRYEMARTAFVGSDGNKIISEKEVSVSGFAGKEFVIQNAQTVQAVRMYLVNQKMFTLVAISPTALKAKNQNSVNKFLNSFELTKIPEPKIAAVTLPGDFGSKMNGNIYQSDFFDFSIELPAEWKILTDEEMEIVREVVNNEADIENTNESKVTKISLRRTALLAGAVTISEASLMIGAERPDFAGMTLESTMKVVRKNQLDAKNVKLAKDIYPATLGGVQFYAVDTVNTADGVKQRIYVTHRKELIFQIVFTYKNENDLKALEDSVRTVKFKVRDF